MGYLALLIGIGYGIFWFRVGDDARVARWWVRHTSGRSIAGPVVLYQGGALAAYLFVLWGGAALADAWGDSWASLLVTAPASLAYVPLVMATCPTETHDPVSSWYEELRGAGMNGQLARRTAWASAPFGLAGLVAIVVSLFLAAG